MGEKDKGGTQTKGGGRDKDRREGTDKWRVHMKERQEKETACKRGKEGVKEERKGGKGSVKSLFYTRDI